MKLSLNLLKYLPISIDTKSKNYDKINSMFDEVNINHRCKIYTPSEVGLFMINELEIDFSKDFKILEPAVGTGNIFVLIVEKYLDYARENCLSNSKIERVLYSSFFAYDLDQESLLVLSNRLNSLLIKRGLSQNIEWHISCGDILDKAFSSAFYNGFDYVISNPPYISYSNLDIVQRKKIASNKYPNLGTTGFDLYLVFIEEMKKYLKEDGRAIAIVPMNFLRTNHARKVYVSLIDANPRLTDVFSFREKTLFPEIAPLSCIIKFSRFLEIGVSAQPVYHKMDTNFERISSVSHSGFADSQEDRTNQATIQDLCHVYGSIAPLNNNLFMISSEEIVGETKNDFSFIKNGENETTEKSVIKIVHCIRDGKGIETKHIIFPYVVKNGSIKRINMSNYPKLNRYLSKHTERDEEKYFGKTQNLQHYYSRKLCFASITKCLNHYYVSRGLVYGGICVVVKNEFKKYEDEIFDAIIKEKSRILSVIYNESIMYSGGYFNLKSPQIKKIILTSPGIKEVLKNVPVDGNTL